MDLPEGSGTVPPGCVFSARLHPFPSQMFQRFRAESIYRCKGTSQTKRAPFGVMPIKLANLHKKRRVLQTFTT